MGKFENILELAINDIRTGKVGGIGERYFTLREFCGVYNISYRTAFKIFDGLKKRGIILLQDKAHFISDCERTKLSASYPFIGVHVRDLNNSFYATLLSALYTEAKRRKKRLIIMSSGNDNEEKRMALKAFIELNCEGVINLNSLNDTDLSDFYSLYPLPFVMYGASPLPQINADFISTDNFNSGYQAAKHLFECGAKHFFYISIGQVLDKKDERYNGFKRFLDEFALNITAIKLPADINQVENLTLLSNEIFKASRKDKLGIFCHHDLIAVTVINLCEQKNIKIPDEVSIIGYDDLDISKYVIPKLTTFSYSFNKIAEKCFDLLEIRIKKPNKPTETAILPTALKVRGSTIRKE